MKNEVLQETAGVTDYTNDGHPQRLRGDFRLGDWLVQPLLNRLTGAEKVIKLEPKVMRVLVCLAEQRGHPVTREQLMRDVWADTFVSDDALNRSISRLRTFLEDDPRRPKVIETIPKIGYRLIAPVVDESKVEPRPSAQPDVMPDKTNGDQSARGGASRRRILLFGGALLCLIVGALLAARFFLAARAFPASLTPSKIVTFTSYRGLELTPSFSPDGKSITFSWSGETGGRRNIYVRPLGAETPLRVTDSPADDDYPVWSPDGGSIAFVRCQANECGVYLVSAVGGPARKLADTGAKESLDLAWSPDGKWLAFPGRDSSDEPYGVVLLSVESLEKKPLTVPPAGFYGDNDVAFSPDGKALAFARMSALGVEDLYTIPVSGDGQHEPARLTADHAKIHGLAWTPDGERIIYAANRAGNYSLWQISATGGVPQWLATGSQNVYDPTLSPRGDRLAYAQASIDTNIWRVDPAHADAPARIVASTQWDWDPQFSPDGSRIAFASDRSGSSEIYLSDSTGANPVRLTSFGGPYVTHPRWSPDGKQIAFDARQGEQSDVYVVGTGGGVPRRLTVELSDETLPGWSRDGRWIYFCSNRGGRSEIWKMPIEGGALRQVTVNGGQMPSESPDGQYVYFSKRDMPGIWRVPTQGGAEEQVTAALQPVDQGNWLVAGQGLYFVERTAEGGPALAFFDFTSREIRQVKKVERLLYKSGLTLSPLDGSLLYTQVDRSESDVMLIQYAEAR